MRFGYRLMRGRQGVSGHARAMGTSAALSVRGLSPGEPCVLYALGEREARMLETRRVDRDGRTQFMVQTDEPLFAVQNGRVVLWEDSPDAEEQFLLASGWIKGENEKKQLKTEGSASRLREQPPVISAARKPKTSKEEPPEEKTSASETERQDTEEITLAAELAVHAEEIVFHPTKDNQPEQKNDPKRFSLRPAGSGEAVDALPILRWPAGTEDLRLNCTLRPPFAPFDAPGWRFVQVPSPLPHVPFCAVGYRAMDARVRDIAYAIPGPQNRPPVRMAGYHYRPGRRGQGYWVMTKQV